MTSDGAALCPLSDAPSMNNSNFVSFDAQPLAFHIRRLRQWQGEAGLSQEELAQLTGVSARSLSRYENSRVLPRPVEMLLALSLALDVPLTSLIDPRVLAKVQSQIEARRSAKPASRSQVI